MEQMSYGVQNAPSIAERLERASVLRNVVVRTRAAEIEPESTGSSGIWQLFGLVLATCALVGAAAMAWPGA